MIGYFDLPSGLSGDMTLGCLLDAGWPVEELRATVGRLPLPTEEYSIEVRTVRRGAFRATLADVKAVVSLQTRYLADIRRILDRADLPAPVKDGAWGVFSRLAEAEAKVHGMTAAEVHFHEVGAVDAIVDIVGAAAGIAALGIDRLYASALPLGAGWTKGCHGQLPLPGPAVLELLAARGAPTRPAPGPGELLTPTGAAILAHYATFEQPAMKLNRVGVGAGQKEFVWPNIARLWIGEISAGAGNNGGNARGADETVDAVEASGAGETGTGETGDGEMGGGAGRAAVGKSDELAGERPASNAARATTGETPAESILKPASGDVAYVQLETNIDDMNPQMYAAVMNALFTAGARDVWLTAIQMKKGRPGVVLSALATADREAELARIILRQTTTLGVRVHAVWRHQARREMAQVPTPWGEIAVKLKLLDGVVIAAMPEYDDCAKAAAAFGAAIKDVYDAALAAGRGLVE